MIEKIYIPTVRRANNQKTFNNLPKELQKKVIMVVEPDERHLYSYPCEYLEIPQDFVRNKDFVKNDKQLSLTRNFIHESAGEIKYAMIDDDLSFQRRNEKYWTGFSNMEKSTRECTKDDMLEMFKKVDIWLDDSDIGIVGLDNAETPPSALYDDTVGVFGVFFINGKKLAPHLPKMDLTSVRVAEDLNFLFECLSYGINTRRTREFIYTNGSLTQEYTDTRKVWGEHDGVQGTLYHTKMHKDSIKIIMEKFPNLLELDETTGHTKKKWKKVFRSKTKHVVKYPIYIVSKGRWDSRLTSKALENMNVDYYIIVEPQEYKEYANVIDKDKILTLPRKYHDEYDPCTDEEHKSNGPGAARNFAWQHSIDNGYSSHWVMDDNIMGFGRVNRNTYHRVKSGAIFRACEDFVDRYENVAISGLQYYMFFPLKEQRPAFIQNTRIYSCILIRNNLAYRWRGRYNEDTDLSLRVLKDGFCTIEFMAFLQEKAMTQTLKGGNTEEFYKQEGTMKKSSMLQRMHPDVAKVIWRYGRWHHFVDYNPFKKNKLIFKKNIELSDETDEYGMVVTKVK